MNLKLGVRALLVLAVVLASTCAIVKPELFGGAAQPHGAAALTMVALHHL
jgi:hypothetical protein